MSHLPQTDLGRFHSNLEKFFSNLKTAYPDDTDLPYYWDKIIAVKKINARMVVENFMSAVEPYIEQIMSKDDNFFLFLDVQSVVEMDSQGMIASNAYVELINKLKTLWNNMTVASKEHIWKYFQIFVTLAVKVNKRHDLVTVLNKYRKMPLTL